jgi:hypothetical protein
VEARVRARPLLAYGAVVAAFAVSLVLALLAVDVVRTDRALERGDARFGGVAGTSGMWEADTVLPAQASRRLLGVTDDIDYRGAVQRFRFVRPREPVQQFSQLTLRAGADRQLARAAREADDPRRQAELLNLRGALALEEARLGSESTPPIRRALTHFRRAAELDPSNHDAQFNLELALRLLSRAGTTSGGSGERASTPASGAGSGSSGSGY